METVAFLIPWILLLGVVMSGLFTINQGYIGSDEKVFDLTYIRNKERYHFVKCTWREYYQIFK